MESQPRNPEFRINPENFHPCKYLECICLLLSYTQYIELLNVRNKL